MTFPKHPIRSKAWYDDCFYRANPTMPIALRRFSESVCDQFEIGGLADPMYIANVAALELGFGDGDSNFHKMDAETYETFSSNLDRLVNHLCFSFSQQLDGAQKELRMLAVSILATRDPFAC